MRRRRGLRVALRCRRLRLRIRRVFGCVGQGRRRLLLRLRRALGEGHVFEGVEPGDIYFAAAHKQNCGEAEQDEKAQKNRHDVKAPGLGFIVAGEELGKGSVLDFFFPLAGWTRSIGLPGREGFAGRGGSAGSGWAERKSSVTGAPSASKILGSDSNLWGLAVNELNLGATGSGWGSIFVSASEGSGAFGHSAGFGSGDAGLGFALACAAAGLACATSGAAGAVAAGAGSAAGAGAGSRVRKALTSRIVQR